KPSDSKSDVKALPENVLVTAKINELSKIDEKKVANEEESMKRQMILGTLNNSVNNLITNAEFTKVRAQLAFSHFGEFDKELAEKGVKAGDAKEAYKKNAVAIAAEYNETPFGLYVNGQIAKAMGTICDLVVNNQCKDGSNAVLFDFLNDGSRQPKLKLPATTNGEAPPDQKVISK
ncbi:MAG: hypothetical protein K2Q18_18375, partial [Bdellovibrionales bacterium]|nr:hypothetical protein [Bdellovibrionales bacterium]